MPSISSSGKERPQSTTTILSSYSKAVMFMPICSRPPKGMIFSLEPPLFTCFVFFNQNTSVSPTERTAAAPERKIRRTMPAVFLRLPAALRAYLTLSGLIPLRPARIGPAAFSHAADVFSAYFYKQQTGSPFRDGLLFTLVIRRARHLSSSTSSSISAKTEATASSSCSSSTVS